MEYICTDFCLSRYEIYEKYIYNHADRCTFLTIDNRDSHSRAVFDDVLKLILCENLNSTMKCQKRENIINKTRNGARNVGGFNKHVLFT